MYIHRRHFAHCLNNHADEPLSDPYAKSFIAAYGFAVKLLNLTKTHFRLDPEMTLSCWPCWEHSITATVSNSTAGLSQTLFSKSYALDYHRVCSDAVHRQ